MTLDNNGFAASLNDAAEPRLSMVPRSPQPPAGWEPLDADGCLGLFSAPGAEARFIAQTEWSEGQQPERISYWEIDMDSNAQHWVLWRSCLSAERELSPNSLPRLDWSTTPSEVAWLHVWRSQPVAACERGQLKIHDAGILLLRYAWQQELRQHSTAAPDYYDATCLISIAELRQLERQVWGA